MIAIKMGKCLNTCTVNILRFDFKCGKSLQRIMPTFFLERFLKLVKLGVVVIATFAVCWTPFLSRREIAFQTLHRLFPFARGLYEAS